MKINEAYNLVILKNEEIREAFFDMEITHLFWIAVVFLLFILWCSFSSNECENSSDKYY